MEAGFKPADRQPLDETETFLEGEDQTRDRAAADGPKFKPRLPSGGR